jgi:hypothetical protein
MGNSESMKIFIDWVSKPRRNIEVNAKSRRDIVTGIIGLWEKKGQTEDLIMLREDHRTIISNLLRLADQS